jgi:cytochrome c biogenesis protein CcmG/thiol:disulfide interchange protein DsbE
MRKILSLSSIILVLIVGLLLLSNCKLQESGENTEEESISSIKEGNTPNDIEEEIEYFNDFTLLDLDKNEVSLSDFQGKIVVLNFWATWCPPCRDEIPDFIEVNNLYKDENVQIIGVSIDTDMKALDDFVEEFDINYPTWIDGTIDNISPEWGIRAIPTTFFLNENGEVIFKNVGRMTKDQIINILEEVL